MTQLNWRQTNWSHC